MKPRMYAFYSQRAIDIGCASNYYEDINGEIIETTHITTDENGAAYLWADKQLLGEVVEWVCQGHGHLGRAKDTLH